MTIEERFDAVTWKPGWAERLAAEFGLSHADMWAMGENAALVTYRYGARMSAHYEAGGTDEDWWKREPIDGLLRDKRDAHLSYLAVHDKRGATETGGDK